MDSRKYSAGAFITVGSLGEDVYQGTIVDVREGQYGKLNLTFKDENKFGLNSTNLKTLQKAYGTDTDSWVNKSVKLVVGELTFADKPVEAVLLTPVSSAKKKSAKPDIGEPIDDEIPFR